MALVLKAGQPTCKIKNPLFPLFTSIKANRLSPINLFYF
jgi:hypothetical protein